MRSQTRYFLFLFVLFCFLSFISCQKAEESLPEVAQQVEKEASDEELTAFVPELRDLHEVVYPLWHSAFPDKDYSLIKELLPQALSLTGKLDEAELPGILRDKQEAWDKGKENLKSALEGKTREILIREIVERTMSRMVNNIGFVVTLMKQEKT